MKRRTARIDYFGMYKVSKYPRGFIIAEKQ